MGQVEELLVEFIRQTQTDLPKDVENALTRAYGGGNGIECGILETILDNIQKSRLKQTPICQDTGNLFFYVKHPVGFSQEMIRQKILSAVEAATKSVPLRVNVVESLSGLSKAGNVGVGLPVIEFSETKESEVEVTLLAKGGGSENATNLYRLPDIELEVGRDLEGVGRCILDAVVETQGKACSPNIIGVGVSGLADEAIALSKKQFLRELDDVHPNERICEFEQRMLYEINRLGVGAMGLGGETTALSVKVGLQDRHPASFFVAVGFGCWAHRRKTKKFRRDLFED